MKRGYPAQWTRPAPPFDAVEVTVLADAGRSRFGDRKLVTVRSGLGLTFTADEADLLCLHDGEVEAGDCLLLAIRARE